MFLVQLVCERVDLKVGSRLSAGSQKRKFLLRVSPSDEEMRQRVDFVDFDVEHDYLSNSTEKEQSRIRKRGRKGVWTYQLTRRYEVGGQLVETKTNLSHRDYKALYAQRAQIHGTIYKTRRCFLYEQQYYQLDILRQRSPPRSVSFTYIYLTSPIHRSIDSMKTFCALKKKATK